MFFSRINLQIIWTVVAIATHTRSGEKNKKEPFLLNSFRSPKSVKGFPSLALKIKWNAFVYLIIYFAAVRMWKGIILNFSTNASAAWLINSENHILRHFFVFWSVKLRFKRCCGIHNTVKNDNFFQMALRILLWTYT